jgi:hypothetical protein
MPLRTPALAGASERVRILTAILLRHPALLAHVGQAYGKLNCPPRSIGSGRHSA